MTAFDGVRRSRTQVMVAVVAVALLALAGFGYLGAKALTEYEGAKEVESDAITLPQTPVAMLATVDDANVLTSVTLIVLRPGDVPGGHIVSVPVSTDSSLGIGEVRTPLSEAYTGGGVEGLQFAVESALTITPDLVSVVTAEQLAGLLAPIGAEVAQSAATALTQHAAGEPESTRRAAVEGAWANVVAAIGALPSDAGDAATSTAASGASTSDVPASIDGYVTRLAAGAVESRGLPTTTIEAADNPDGKDVEALDRVEAVMVLATIAPANMSTPAPGMVFRIEAPAGNDAKVKLVINYLLAIGGNVKSVSLNADIGAKSLVLVGDFKFREQIKSQGLVIDELDMETPDRPISGIDVILKLGTDYLDTITLDDPEYVNPSTTTSTTTA